MKIRSQDLPDVRGVKSSTSSPNKSKAGLPMPVGIESRGDQSYTILEYADSDSDGEHTGNKDGKNAGRNMLICFFAVLVMAVFLGVGMSLRFMGAGKSEYSFENPKKGYRYLSGGGESSAGNTFSDKIGNAWSGFVNNFDMKRTSSSGSAFLAKRDG